MANKIEKHYDPTLNWNIAILAAVIIMLIIILNFKFICNGQTTPTSKQQISLNSDFTLGSYS